MGLGLEVDCPPCAVSQAPDHCRHFGALLAQLPVRLPAWPDQARGVRVIVEANCKFADAKRLLLFAHR
jgi:hypothetical protein